MSDDTQHHTTEEPKRPISHVREIRTGQVRITRNIVPPPSGLILPKR